MKNGIFWSEIGSGIGEPGGTSPPRIVRSTPSPRAQRWLYAMLTILLFLIHPIGTYKVCDQANSWIRHTKKHLWCELTLFIDWLNWFNFQFITDKGFMVISHQGIWSIIFYQSIFPQNVNYIHCSCWVSYKINERIFCSHLASLADNMLLTEGIMY